jgi:hypothetical protein
LWMKHQQMQSIIIYYYIQVLDLSTEHIHRRSRPFVLLRPYVLTISPAHHTQDHKDTVNHPSTNQKLNRFLQHTHQIPHPTTTKQAGTSPTNTSQNSKIGRPQTEPGTTKNPHHTPQARVIFLQWRKTNNPE